MAAAIARYGRLDGALVGVAAPERGTVVDTDDGDWRLALETFFLAPLRLCRAVARNVSQEGGSLVLVLSTSVREPVEGSALSNGLRPALAMTAKALADELGPQALRVNSVLPGRIEGAGSSGERWGDERDDSRAAHEARIPLRRYGEPLEFARPAVFLLSPAASYVTGTVLTVDGGANAHPVKSSRAHNLVGDHAIRSDHARGLQMIELPDRMIGPDCMISARGRCARVRREGEQTAALAARCRSQTAGAWAGTCAGDSSNWVR